MITETNGPPVAAPPHPPQTRALLSCGLAAGPLFLGVGVLQGLTREGFDFTRNAISQLSLGALGWIQVCSFVLTAVLILAGAAGMRRAMRGAPGGRWAPALVAVFGASFLVAAVFPADPGAGFPPGVPEAASASLSTQGMVHMLAGMVGYLTLCAAFGVLARHFAAEGSRAWAIACGIVPLGVLAGFAASAALVLAFTAGAGLGLLWLAAVCTRLLTAAPVAQS
jgi:hypothetical protein